MRRAPDRPDARSEGHPTPALCERLQWQVCRLAAGAPLEVGARPLARHLQSCRTCDAFADELGQVRRWLERRPAPDELTAARDDDGVAARRALARELMARLARDLLALGRGQEPRTLELRRRDLRRLDGLGPRGWWARSDAGGYRAALDLSVSDGPVRREAALEAAALLDPLGLDVTLAWMSCLGRAGRGALAHRLADRLLCGLT